MPNKKIVSLFIAVFFLIQFGFIIRAYSEAGSNVQFQTLPDKRSYEFGYQLYHEWSEYKFELFRTVKDGRAVPIAQSGAWIVNAPSGRIREYRWSDMVNTPRIQRPGSDTFQYANRGMTVTTRRIKGALDYVIDNIPHDRETVRISATITYFYNSRNPQRVEIIHSKTRDIYETVE